MGVTPAQPAADEPTMTTSVVGVSETEAAEEYRTTEAPCVVCMTTLPMDDEQSRVGTVRWRVASDSLLRMGTAVGFACPNGHSSNDDPGLLKAFPRRRMR
jgi:hypothetical protein